MKIVDRIAIGLIDFIYSGLGRFLPISITKKVYAYVIKVFELEAIDCYYSDIKDVGFFESFLLGADETKRITHEASETIEKIKQIELIEKLAGYIPSQKIRRSQESEVVKENIDSKKKIVVQKLKEKGEIIKYLGRRIVCRNERLFKKLENLYNRLEKVIKDDQ